MGIAAYLITNVTLYAFLLYYSVVELLIQADVADKLEAAVAVYFILELDDWLYNVTIEPLKILEDEEAEACDVLVLGHLLVGACLAGHFVFDQGARGTHQST